MIGPRGVALVKRFEGGPFLEAYVCPAGKWTIGWGHTRGVKEGDLCTPEEAEIYLEADLAEAEAAVRRWIDVPLTQSMLEALTSWTLNLGAGKLRISTMARRLNSFDYLAVPSEMKRWVWAKSPETGDLVELPGLVARREAEAALFLADGMPSP